MSLRFVSIGDPEKLTKFLDLNPAVPRSSVFVDAGFDAQTFNAYDSAGFGVMDKAPSDTKLTVPRLGSAGAWWRYLSNVASLSPVPKSFKFGTVPEGVLRLGGTFLIDQDRVLFAHADQFPGDHPDIENVLKAAGL